MSRGLIETSKHAFRSFDEYCADSEVIPETSGKDRYIAGDKSEQDILQYAKIKDNFLFSGDKLLAFVQVDDLAKIILVDFPNFKYLPHFEEEEHSCAGITTLLLAENLIYPSAEPRIVRDSLDIGFVGDGESYSGHLLRSITSLLPDIRILNAEIRSIEDIWSVFLLICIDEKESHRSWMNQTFLNELKLLSDVPSNNIPYSTICRSIFDNDKGSIFMALYRCLEGIYFYDKAMELKKTFQLNYDWHDIAVKVEETISWRPRELSSLEVLIQNCDPLDLNYIVPSVTGAPDVTTSAVAKEIYSIRNSLVHYRPIHKNNSKLDQLENFTDDRWNNLCIGLVRIIKIAYLKVV